VRSHTGGSIPSIVKTGGTVNFEITRTGDSQINRMESTVSKTNRIKLKIHPYENK